ncbi:MAG: tRNA (adenosine(37)-N6)-dimethylallyltransferase MiaA [Candidatus Paceibacterota bacterium]
MEKKLPKILAIAGPTSSGKSDLAVFLAQKWNGEIVSADSRQVYRGLDIATGKITKKEMHGIPHHLLSVVDPKEQYAVSHFKRDAEKAVDDILSRGKLPILCGGTGQYMDAVTENFIAPQTKPDPKLRRKLEAKNTDELFAELKKLDPARANTIDRHNPRRLIRAIEIATAEGSVPQISKTPKKYNALKIAIATDKETLQARIWDRVLKRIEQGMVEEAEKLRRGGLTFERMKELGLEYRYLAEYLEGKITLEKMKEEIFFKDRQYAKRQLTWWKRDPNIHWFPLSERDAVMALIESFLKK